MPLAGDQGIGGLERHADEAILTPSIFLIQYGGSGVLPVVSLTTLAASHLKFGAAVRVMREVAAVDRVAAAVLHPDQLGDTLVELVVANAGHVEVHGVEQFHRRLVVEQSGERRRTADQVARGDGEAVWWPLRSMASSAARYSAPPAATPSIMPGVLASRWPW